MVAININYSYEINVILFCLWVFNCILYLIIAKGEGIFISIGQHGKSVRAVFLCLTLS